VNLSARSTPSSYEGRMRCLSTRGEHFDLLKHVNGDVRCACLRTSSSSELFSESLSDGMPCILCMFLVHRADRVYQQLDICCWQLARMHMQRSDCPASNGRCNAGSASSSLKYESDDGDELKQPQTEVGCNLQVRCGKLQVLLQVLHQ
jgi:hypothetical protein